MKLLIIYPLVLNVSYALLVSLDPTLFTLPPIDSTIDITTFYTHYIKSLSFESFIKTSPTTNCIPLLPTLSTPTIHTIGDLIIIKSPTYYNNRLIISSECIVSINKTLHQVISIRYPLVCSISLDYSVDESPNHSTTNHSMNYSIHSTINHSIHSPNQSIHSPNHSIHSTLAYTLTSTHLSPVHVNHYKREITCSISNHTLLFYNNV